jgi:hypothetical protein
VGEGGGEVVTVTIKKAFEGEGEVGEGGGEGVDGMVKFFTEGEVSEGVGELVYCLVDVTA